MIKPNSKRTSVRDSSSDRDMEANRRSPTAATVSKLAIRSVASSVINGVNTDRVAGPERFWHGAARSDGCGLARGPGRRVRQRPGRSHYHTARQRGADTNGLCLNCHKMTRSRITVVCGTVQPGPDPPWGALGVRARRRSGPLVLHRAKSPVPELLGSIT